jgi:uncharacterized protein (TIGR02266 family)
MDEHQKRRHARRSSELPVRISTIDPEKDPWTGRPFFRSIQETCANVSRGGAFVRTREQFESGRRVLVELTLPDGRELEAIGRVAWTKRVLAPEGGSDDVGLGVEFLGAASEELTALEAFLADDGEDTRSDS